MAVVRGLTLFCVIGIAAALPAQSIVIRKEPGLRYQYDTDSKGENRLVDTWTTLDHLKEAARFNPMITNAYHLFTRANPSLSQPLVINNAGMLQASNFDGQKRTVVMVHDRNQTAGSEFTTVLVPALLAAADLNVIVVDWSAGASADELNVAVLNTISSGSAVAQFIQWLNGATGSTPSQMHLVGHGFGGHQVGIIGRNLGGNVSYITGLNPSALGWLINHNKFQPDDGLYTEVIHTNFVLGHYPPLAQVDFYPNRGVSMAGCEEFDCDHTMGYFYFAESVVSGGFTGRQCRHFMAAYLNECNILQERLQMGGLVPKTGSTGVFLLHTYFASPFSMD